MTRNAVIGKVHRLGLSGRVKTAAPPPVQPVRVKLKAVQAEPPAAVAASPAPPAVKPLAPVLVAVGRRATDVVIPISPRVTIMELRESMCRWPLGDPASAEFRYCGCRSAVGPYCREHATLAFQPTQDRRRVERLARIA